MDIDVVKGFVVLKEEFPKRSKMEICVGEEKECDFGFGIGGAKAGDGGAATEGREGGAAEEGEVVELVGERDFDVFGRENTWDEEEKQRE